MAGLDSFRNADGSFNINAFIVADAAKDAELGVGRTPWAHRDIDTTVVHPKAYHVWQYSQDRMELRIQEEYRPNAVKGVLPATWRNRQAAWEWTVKARVEGTFKVMACENGYCPLNSGRESCVSLLDDALAARAKEREG